jgi:selenocysteine lyase/cysteine desulfurase
MFNEMGTEKTEKRILNLTAMLMDSLEDLDFEIFTPKNDQQRAGIVSFRHPSVSSSHIFEALTAENVICSLREGWVRFSLHFYNGEDEIERAVSILKKIIG